ncbi:PI-PLC X domain-containing protein 1-like isoform X1 [Artemia franciscana]|uniref:PI-PLC X domain-containing protein 1-like isoform X1 n=1 Tax=Artemia franciscana TaxID=6661 RepID=UPI0032DBF28A
MYIMLVNFLLFFGLLQSLHSKQFYDCAVSPKKRLYLTVSPIAKIVSNSPVNRQLELNWVNFENLDGDWIGLFDYDPKNVSNLNPLVRVDANDFPGYYRTIVEFPIYSLKNKSEECIGYWIAYIRNKKKILSKNCIRPKKQWMFDSRFSIGEFPLHSVFLPGVHNGGSYFPYSPSSDTIITRYSVCQDEDIYNQLSYGIRYLDLRVGYYSDLPEKFWVNHDVYRFHPLSAVVNDLLAFVKESRDVVIVDIHRFPAGFKSNNRAKHQELVNYLERSLGEHLIPRALGLDVTLNDIWRTNSTIILAYADRHTAMTHPLLWPTIPQEWGDKQTLPSLKAFIKHAMNRRSYSNYPWAAMAELTPTTFDILFRPSEGIRKLAGLSNREVTKWFREDWWDRASIVAVDFFLSTDIVDVAINANLDRIYCINVSRSTTFPVNDTALVNPVSIPY